MRLVPPNFFDLKKFESVDLVLTNDTAQPNNKELFCITSITPRARYYAFLFMGISGLQRPRPRDWCGSSFRLLQAAAPMF